MAIIDDVIAAIEGAIEFLERNEFDDAKTRVKDALRDLPKVMQDFPGEQESLVECSDLLGNALDSIDVHNKIVAKSELDSALSALRDLVSGEKV